MTASPTTASEPLRSARIGLAIVCLGSLLGPLDSSVNVAFPAITRAFDIALGDIRWIIIGFVIAQSSLSIVFGKLGDLYGHRRIFQLGLATCALAHLACGFAPTYSALIVLRMVQGLAVGIAMACAPALATLLFPETHKRRVLAIYLMLFSVGVAIGPIAGGLLLPWTDWPGVFWFRVPIALLALVLSTAIPRMPPQREGARRVDWLGAAWLVVALSCLVLLISFADRHALAAIGLLVAGTVAFTLFVRQEADHPEPILPVRAFLAPGFASLQLAAVLVNLCCFAIMLLLPYWLADRSDYSPAGSGALLALFPIGSIVANGLAGTVVRHLAARQLVRLGVALSGLGLLAIGVAISWEAPLAVIAAAMFVAGIGLGVFQLGHADATTTQLPIAERGVAGSLINVTRLVGFVLGAALISVLYAWLQQHLGARAFAWSFSLLGAALGLLALALRTRYHHENRPHDIA